MLLGIPLNGCDPQLAQPGDEVRQPQGVPRGGRAAARRLRGPAHARTRSARRSSSCARGGRACGARWSSSTRASPARATRSSATPRRTRSAALVESLRQVEFAVSRGDARGLLRQDGEDGRDRRGVRRGGGEALAERPAADRAARRRAADLDPRPDPGRPERPGLPRLPLPRPRRLPHGDPGGEPAHRAGALGARCRESLRRRLPGASRLAERAVEDDGARDQPAHGRHHPPLPGAPVPDGRQPRSGDAGSSSRRADRPSTTGPPTTSTRRATAACCPRT